MASTFRIQAVLADRHGERLQGHRVAALAGMSVQLFHKMASGLIQKGAISRTKLPGDSFFAYYLTDEQLRVFRLKKSLHDLQHGGDLAMIANTEDIPARLSFLNMLKDRTIFREHHMLKVIISDYERTMQFRRKIEEREDG